VEGTDRFIKANAVLPVVTPRLSAVPCRVRFFLVSGSDPDFARLIGIEMP